MCLTYYRNWLIPVLDGTFRALPLQFDCWKGKLVNPQTTKLLELPVEKGHLNYLERLCFFHFQFRWEPSAFLFCCSVSSALNEDSRACLQLKSGGERGGYLSWSMLFHQECEECLDLCCPHLLSLLNYKTLGSRKLFNENICVVLLEQDI